MSKKAVSGILALIIVITAGAVLYFNNTEKTAAPGKEEVLSKEQMLQEINKKNVTIVDLREPELFTAGHIPNAINIPFNEIFNRFRELDQDKKVIFVCHTGRMGDESSKFLIEKGYSQVANLKGGMAQWDGPVVKK